MLRGVGLDLAAIHRHAPDLHGAGFPGQPQHLGEQALERRQVDLAEIGNGPKVWVLPAASTRKATSSTNRLAIFLDENTPTQYP